MSDGYLSSLLPDVQEGIEGDARRERYKTDPVLWVEDMLGDQFWEKQEEIAYSVRDNRRTAVAAGHGVGKSWSASYIAVWWLDTHPASSDETFFASTAPTVDQVNILWDGIRRAYAKLSARHKEYKRRLAANLDLGEYAANDHMPPGYITGDNKIKLKNGEILGQGRKPPDQKADVAFQGRHATFLLAIIDEGVGVSSDFFDAVSSIVTGDYNRELVLANPTDPGSRMAKIWRDSENSKSQDRWHTMHISVMDSPLITEEPGFDISRAQGLSGWKYVNERKEEWGEDDPRYIARVLGQWAFDAGNTVFTEFELAQAKNCVVIPDPNSKPQQGWDIARMGPDSTVGYQAREGEVWLTDPETGELTEPTGRRGLHVRRVEAWTKAPITSSDPENLGSAQRIDAHMLAEGASVAAIDASGMGSDLMDGIREIWRQRGKNGYKMVEIFGQATSVDRRSYTNARAEQYFELKRRFFAGEIDLDAADEILFDELGGIVYEYDAKGARKIQSKDDMKKKGKKSPDYADALWYSAMDVTHLVEGILAGAKKGDTLYQNPWALLDSKRYAVGTPM